MAIALLTLAQQSLSFLEICTFLLEFCEPNAQFVQFADQLFFGCVLVLHAFSSRNEALSGKTEKHGDHRGISCSMKFGILESIA